jgi:demethoxyubiquinone hydroxylase (CLK1/Coq7/Cat5 family)
MFNILKVKLGENEAKALTEYVESQVEKSVEKEKNILATKEDIYKLEVKMSEMKSDIIKWMFIFWIGQIAVTLGIVYYRG